MDAEIPDIGQHTCQFHPGYEEEHREICGAPASKQVLIKLKEGDMYLWICDSCIPLAQQFWADNNYEYEF